MIRDSVGATFVSWETFANGEYLVTIVIWEQSYCHDLIDVYIEGVLKIDDLTDERAR